VKSLEERLRNAPKEPQTKVTVHLNWLSLADNAYQMGSSVAGLLAWAFAECNRAEKTK